MTHVSSSTISNSTCQQAIQLPASTTEPTSATEATEGTRATATHDAHGTHDILIKSHLGLVMHIAKRYERRYQGQHILDLDDLVQEGMLGLIRAAERFDARKGFQFSTYASYWIRQAMWQAITSVSRTIRLPEHAWSASRRLAHAQATLWQHQQREPSVDELAKALQDEQEQVLMLLQHQHQVLSLDQPVYTEQGSTETTLLGEQLAAPDDSEYMEQRERQQEVAELLKHLSRQERQIIELRYQLGQTTACYSKDIPVPYVAVGRHVQMSAERVKSVERRALRKMRFWAERRQRVGSAWEEHEEPNRKEATT